MRAKAALALVAALVAPSHAIACSFLSPQSQARLERQQARYLARESDIVVNGVWHQTGQDADFLHGVIAVERRGTTVSYRVSVRREINCGFPYYFLRNGDTGRFYLNRDNDPDPEDLNDGFIDNFNYIHFEASSNQ